MNTIIVAYNEKGVIGNNMGKVPWHIPDDLKFFKETTKGGICIMGRKTWESLPSKYKPLSGRTNVIVTRTEVTVPTHRNVMYEPSRIYVCSCLEEALNLFILGDEEVFITGGGEIYRYALKKNLVDRVLASEIKNHLDVPGATTFPNLKELGWTGKVIKQFPDFDVVEYLKTTDLDGLDKEPETDEPWIPTNFIPGELDIR